MCETCLNDPSVGPEIMDLSIFPFPVFFFPPEALVTLPAAYTKERMIHMGEIGPTTVHLSFVHFLIERLGFTLVSKYDANHAFLRNRVSKLDVNDVEKSR